jgi:parallel beta-helix repeat protein
MKVAVMRKTLPAVIILLELLFSAVAGTQLANLASANFLQPDVPEHTFEIKESGNVIEKVGTDRIQRNGTLYTFTEDIFGSIVIFHNNMVIDGAGYSLQGNGTGTGIFLQGINNVTVKNLRITNFTVGIEVTWSSVAFGVDSSNIVVQGNTITNTEYGIHAESPINLRVLENTISNNKMGIFSYDFSGLESHGIFVYGNNISSNSVGIETHQIKSTVYHNNFLNNTSQANATKPYWYYWYTTMWHDYSLKEGNFWSNYNGTDANGDGIGDTPYIVDANNTDHYPLMKPISADSSKEPTSTPSQTPKIEPEPFSITLVAVTSGLLAVVVAVFLVYFRKRNFKGGTKALKTRALVLTLIWAFLFLGVANTMLVNAREPWEPAPLPEHTLEIQSSGGVVEIVRTDKIRQNGSVYTFTEDVFGNIAVFCDNIVIDGAGHSLQGNGTGTGFFLQERNNVTIRNVRINNFSVGIDLTWLWLGKKDANNVFQGNIITHNTYGIMCDLTGNATILENTISNNEIGISCFSSSIFVSGNNISNNGQGIRIIISDGSVYHNSFINNTLQVNFDPDSAYGRLPSTIVWDKDSDKKGNYWSDYNGTDSNGDAIGDTPYVIYENHTDRYPLVTPWGPPAIFVIHPENVAYATSVPLNFTVSKSTLWMGYSLDGQDNVTITGNITLTGLAGGLHNITFYATDIYGSVGASETIHFSIETFPTTLVIASAVSVAIACIGLLVYFKKRNH